MIRDSHRRAAANVNHPLSIGYSPVSSGMTASVVTYLEMTAPPPRRAASNTDCFPAPLLWRAPDLDQYRALYRAVGQDWLWVSRLEIADDDLRMILADPLVRVYTLTDGARHVGLLELDFREPDQCELAFLGLRNEVIGTGVGRSLMSFAIDRAWSESIRRFWLHTCSFDHPRAITFYLRSGFRPYACMVEVMNDPRLTGLIPRYAAPQVPLLGE
jgi:GNAT superfamily N-acetyltransferase